MSDTEAALIAVKTRKMVTAIAEVMEKCDGFTDIRVVCGALAHLTGNVARASGDTETFMRIFDTLANGVAAGNFDK